MKIQRAKDLKIGDIVKVDHMTLDGDYKWTGMCNWHDGSTDDNGKPVGNAYKFSFIVMSNTDAEYKANDEITWTIHDLRLAEAEVISESKSR